MTRRVLAQYDNAPLAQQVYSVVRLQICPFEPLAAFVPPRGRLLDVGCGYGIWLNYLALRYPDLQMIGIDIDSRKLNGARRSRDPRLVFQHAPLDAFPAQSFDCITFVDVLYLMDLDTRHKLLSLAARALVPGGTLLVKEMDNHPRWKAAWNAMQETLAVRVLHLTRGERIEFISARQQAEMLDAVGLQNIQIFPLDRGYVHPHVLVRASART